MKRWMTKTLLSVLALLLIAGVVVSVVAYSSHAAHAAGGCGTGVNATTVITPPSTTTIRRTGVYQIKLDKCKADAQAIHYRNDANNGTFCTVPAATVGTVASFFIGVAPPIAIPVSIGSFTIAGGCGLLQAEALKNAGFIAERNAFCGTDGIVYNLTVSHIPARFGRSYIKLDAPDCQPGGAVDKGSNPNKGTIAFFTTVNNLTGIWTGTNSNAGSQTLVFDLDPAPNTTYHGEDFEGGGTSTFTSVTFDGSSTVFPIAVYNCNVTMSLTLSEDASGYYLDGTEVYDCTHVTATVHLVLYQS